MKANINAMFALRRRQCGPGFTPASTLAEPGAPRGRSSRNTEGAKSRSRISRWRRRAIFAPERSPSGSTAVGAFPQDANFRVFGGNPTYRALEFAAILKFCVWETTLMRNLIVKIAPAVLFAVGATPAAACFFGCRPGEGEARAVLDHLVSSRLSPSYRIVDFKVTRTADFDILVGEIRGYEIFYKATVEFPQGAHLDCEPAKGAARPDDCSDDPYFSLVRETRPKPGRQFIEAGGRRTFDEDFRFAEIKGQWRGPDGQSYAPK